MAFRCNDCNYRSHFAGFMKSHRRRTGHRPRYLCEECNGRLFVNAKALQDHLDTAVAHCTCPYCDKAPFWTRTALEQHLRDKHGIVWVTDDQPMDEHTPLLPRDADEENLGGSFSWRDLCCCLC